MEKSGQISIQFNWIFVLIVGAIILLFFGNIIHTQQKISENKISATVLNDIDAISSGAEVSRGTVQVISIPKLDLGFSCSDTCACAYSLGNMNVEFGDKVMFAPDMIQGRMITAWTYDWSMPYRVSNMLYMTSPDIRYIIVDDVNGNIAEELNRSLPPKLMLIEGNEEIIFNKEFIKPQDLKEIKSYNNYKVKIIGFGDMSSSSDCSNSALFDITCDVPEALQRMGDNKVTALRIEPGSTKDHGQLIFLKKSGNSWGNSAMLPYIGESMLYAALFSEDADMYRCGVERVFEKMMYVTDMYTRRTEALMSRSAQPDCQARYSRALSMLRGSGSSPGIKDTVQDVLQNGISYSRLGRLYTMSFGSNQFNELNNQLQVTSCEELY